MLAAHTHTHSHTDRANLFVKQQNAAIIWLCLGTLRPLFAAKEAVVIERYAKRI